MTPLQRFARLSVVVVAALLLGLASAAAGVGQDNPPADGHGDDLKGSPAAQGAVRKFEKDVEAAGQDFQRKVLLLRKEYEQKVAAARKAYVAGLTRAKAEETRKGKLEVAVAVKALIDQAQAAAPPSWPEQVLPAEAPAPTPAGGPAAATRQAGGGKVNLGDFSNSAAVTRAWDFDGKDWQIRDGSVWLKGDTRNMTSRFKLRGDLQVRIVCERPEGVYGQMEAFVCGERVLFFRPQGRAVVEVARKGDTMQIAVNGERSTIKLKEEAMNEAHPLRFYTEYNQAVIRSVNVKAQEIVNPEGP